MGMSVHEYNNITYADLMYKVNGFNSRVRTNIVLKRYQLWVTYISPHLDPKKMAKTIDELMPLPDDNDRDNKPKRKVSDEKRKRLAAYLEYRQKQKNGEA